MLPQNPPLPQEHGAGEPGFIPPGHPPHGPAAGVQGVQPDPAMAGLPQAPQGVLPVPAMAGFPQAPQGVPPVPAVAGLAQAPQAPQLQPLGLAPQYVTSPMRPIVVSDYTPLGIVHRVAYIAVDDASPSSHNYPTIDQVSLCFFFHKSLNIYFQGQGNVLASSPVLQPPAPVAETVPVPQEAAVVTTPQVQRTVVEPDLLVNAELDLGTPAADGERMHVEQEENLDASRDSAFVPHPHMEDEAEVSGVHDLSFEDPSPFSAPLPVVDALRHPVTPKLKPKGSKSTNRSRKQKTPKSQCSENQFSTVQDATSYIDSRRSLTQDEDDVAEDLDAPRGDALLLDYLYRKNSRFF